MRNDGSVVEDNDTDMLLGSSRQTPAPRNELHSQGEVAYLPICYKSGKHIRLSYITTFADEDDAIILKLLRISYEKYRGNKVRRWLSIWVLGEIKRVRVFPFAA